MSSAHLELSAHKNKHQHPRKLPQADLAPFCTAPKRCLKLSRPPLAIVVPPSPVQEKSTIPQFVRKQNSLICKCEVGIAAEIVFFLVNIYTRLC